MPETRPRLDGYVFLHELGKGAMGTVYLARQLSLDRLVAIKRIDPAWGQDAERIARFRREAQTLAALNHPSIVAVYQLDVVDGGLSLVMEYVAGPSLRQVMDNSDVAIPDSLAVIRDVSDALGHAASRNVVHRDVKPSNILVAPDGRAKLADFGLVRLAGGGAALTSAGQVLGTPAYMSPEQATGKEADSRSDVYSLAVMAYEMLVGRLPFLSVPGNPIATLQAHIHGQAPLPSSVVPGFPRGVERALMAGLEKSPGARPADGRRFWDRLGAEADDAWPGWERQAAPAALAKSYSPPASTDPLAATLVLGAAVDPTVRLPSAQENVAPTMRLDKVEPAEPGATLLYTGAAPAPIAARPMARPAARALPAASRPEPASKTYRRPAAEGIALPGSRKAGGGSRRSLYLVALAAIVIAAVLVVLLVQRRAPSPAPPALAVTGITVRVAPTVGHCPSATFLFTATMSTNGGAGNVVYQWMEPDGSTSAQTTVSIGSNSSTADATLRFTFSGSGTATGSAVLQVLEPNPTRSAPVPIQYACP